jgi:hypothetical protein
LPIELERPEKNAMVAEVLAVLLGGGGARRAATAVSYRAPCGNIYERKRSLVAVRVRWAQHSIWDELQ